MPSFLSKVFGRKKTDEKDKEKEPSSPSPASPLGGKFEAVRLSPSVANFGEGRPNGTRANAEPIRKSSDVAPHLSLNLPGAKDDKQKPLGLVFGGGVSLQTVLSDSAIGERRLSPSEAQLLVQACSEVIVSRGLETLGLMHPHWHSSSPDVQRKLISLFLNSLAAGSAVTTLSNTPLSEFQSELGFTRTPQDVAAVLRWGLRHLKLEGSQFGRNSSWYHDFYQTEASASYPPKAYSTILSPLIPPPHLQLLTSLLNLVAYIAAHAEANGISGSKLSKFIGLWLLTTERHKPSDDWKTFYERWEVAGRQFEHIFLSQIRDDAADHPVPRRLAELVKQYPYSATKDLDLLPRPRLSTHQYDALLVRIQTTLPGFKSLKPPPLQLITEALAAAAQATSDSQAYEIWQQIKAATGEGEPDILSDESFRILSLTSNSERPLSPTFRDTRRDSPATSEKDVASSTRHLNGTTWTPSDDSHRPHPPSSYQALGAADWAQFSQSGFLDSPSLSGALAATLMDKDVEVTEPPPPSIKRSLSRRSTASTIRHRKSMDTPPPVPSIPTSITNPEKDEPPKPTSTVTEASIVQLDEAFIDFWHDALIDPIASNWPNFVLARLKHSIATQLKSEGREIEWVIIEQTFTKPPPPPAPAPLIIPSLSQQTATSATTSSPGSRRPAPSPKPSQRSDTSKKRFSFFSARTSSEKGTKAKKGSQSPVVGELGELVQDSPPPVARETKLSTVGENVASGVTAGAAGLAIGGAAVAAATNTTEEPPKVEPAPELTPASEQATEVSQTAEVKAPEDPATVVAPQTATEPEIVVEEPAIVVQEPTVVADASSEPVKSTGHNESAIEGQVIEAASIVEEPIKEEPVTGPKGETAPTPAQVTVEELPIATEEPTTVNLAVADTAIVEEPVVAAVSPETAPIAVDEPIIPTSLGTPVPAEDALEEPSKSQLAQALDEVRSPSPVATEQHSVSPDSPNQQPLPPSESVPVTHKASPNPVVEEPAEAEQVATEETAPVVEEVATVPTPDAPQEKIESPVKVEEPVQPEEQPSPQPDAGSATVDVPIVGVQYIANDEEIVEEPKAEVLNGVPVEEMPHVEATKASVTLTDNAPLEEQVLAVEPELNAPVDEPSTETEVPAQGSAPDVEHDDLAVSASQAIPEPTLEEVSPHIEPLPVSPTAGDEAVVLPEVPVVQAEAEAPSLAVPVEAVSETAPVAEAPLPDESKSDEGSSLPSAVEPIIASGETPGPQLMFSAAESALEVPADSEPTGKLQEPEEELALPVTPQPLEEEEAVAPLTFTSAPVDDGSPSKTPLQLSPIEPKSEAEPKANLDKAE